MPRLPKLTVALVLLFAPPGPLHGQAVCPTPWQVEPTLVLGSAEGALTFTNVLEIEHGPGGRIYLAQSFVPHVTVLNAQGRLERTLGRVGQGPGEFQQMATGVGFKGDTLWARHLGGIEFFTSSGAPLRRAAFRTAVPEEGSVFTPGVPLADGSYLGARTITGATFRAYNDRDEFPLLRFGPGGEILDTIARVRRPSELSFVRVPRMPDGLIQYLEHPLAMRGGVSSLPAAVTADGRAVVLIGEVRVAQPRRTLFRLAAPPRGTFELLRIGISGDTLLRVAVPFEPRPVTRQEREWLTEAFAARHAGDYDADNPMPNPFDNPSPVVREQRRRAAREAIAFPETHPPVRRVLAGRDGTIWLLRELQRDRIDRWEVYDARGQLLGRVHLSEGEARIPWMPRLRLLSATREEIWGVTQDQLGVQTLRRYGLRNPCR